VKIITKHTPYTTIALTHYEPSKRWSLFKLIIFFLTIKVVVINKKRSRSTNQKWRIVIWYVPERIKKRAVTRVDFWTTSIAFYRAPSQV